MASSRGEPDFERVVEQYYEDVYRFAFSLSRSESDAADLTQHAFFRYAQHRKDLRNFAGIKPWLLRTAKNRFLDQTRRARRFPQVQIEENRPPGDAPPADPALAIDGRAAVEALQKLDDRFRLPLALYYLEGLPYREIAEVLGIPAGTVMSRLARAKRHLRALLENPPKP